MKNRKESVEARIGELNELLDQWEEHRLTARDPSEERRSVKEIARIKSYLHQYQSELMGGGVVVHEDKKDPITRPEIKRVNRNWILSIIAAIVLLISLFFIYEKATELNPDYDKYLEYLAAGDNFLEDKQFKDAQLAYEKAQEYFPQDTVVARKVNLLRKANQMVEQDSFQKAERIFKIILNIPAESKLSFQQTNPTDENTKANASSPSASQMQLVIEWLDGALIITIKGGTPFSNPNAPYKVEGVDCPDCIKWSPLPGGGYAGQLDAGKTLNVNLLSVRDQTGNRAQQQVPNRPDSSNTIKETDGKKEVTPVETPSKTVDDKKVQEEKFNGLITAADENFAKKNYALAKQDYEAALNIRQSSHAKERSAACDKEINKQKLADAKRIARISLPAGSFNMGTENGFSTEKPVHKVQLKAFRLSKNEITVKQYRLFCDLTGREMPPAPPYGINESFPITMVNWDDANAFAHWVGGRLPTEAEWEYAATDGGGVATYSGGNNLSRVAIYSNNSNDAPKNVGSKGSNGFGINDLTGNVSEWCLDWEGKYSSDNLTNPTGPSSGKYRIVRGGGYNSSSNSTQDGDQLRVTYRNSRKPGTREPYIGFRVAW